jgi:hemolysin III
MRKFFSFLDREQTTGEEIANSISHGLGLAAALVSIPFLLLHAVKIGSTGYIVGVSVFAASIVLLYLGSTLYHALQHSAAKRVFRAIEHSAIFILIAGTYTPFTLGVLNGSWGWSIFGVIWGLALIGITLKVVFRGSHNLLYVGLYLLMGWTIVVAIKPMLTLVPMEGLLWLLAGGLAYTIGVLFYVFDSRLKYGHAIWHLFVIAGTTCHYFSVYWYAA